MAHSNLFLSDFVEIQRQGFFYLLEKGIVEEIEKRNPITNFEKEIEIFFYPEYSRFTKPFYSIEQAIFFRKSYVSKFYIPVQLTDRKKKRVFLKWILLAHFPLMTNRGHFVLNGSPRVIIHQLVRSPGIYFRENLHEIYSSKWSEKPTTKFRRFYADIICSKGTWLRIESEKDFSMWAKMKKGPKIPLLWFLLGMGLSEKYILNSVSKPVHLLESFKKEIEKLQNSNSQKEMKYPYISTPKRAWEEIQKLFKLKKVLKKSLGRVASTENKRNDSSLHSVQKPFSQSLNAEKKIQNRQVQSSVSLLRPKKTSFSFQLEETKGKKGSSQGAVETHIYQKNLLGSTTKKFESYELGRRWFFNKFMNSRMYDLGKQGRLAINKKLGLTIPIEQTTLTAFDVLSTTDFLMKLQDGCFEVDDIDHLKNKRVRSSGECIQEIFSIGFLRLEKSIRLKLNTQQKFSSQISNQNTFFLSSAGSSHPDVWAGEAGHQSFLNTRPINGAFREFFGTHPLSQFMDQINPLAEITHKRRLSSLGPGGVSRDTATLAIRGIHPSHYGRICPIETPEGKNTGLVNSITSYAKLSLQGFLKSPFYKVYKGQVQKNLGVFFLGPEQEERFFIATPDLNFTALNFLPKNPVPVRSQKRFLRMKTHRLAIMGVSPLQMISVATSFIPFLEHDDANRALMGSNMQRQAVPLIRPERPLLGTGLEARVISDSGHALLSKTSGYILYSSGVKIFVYTL